jgi:hypothetical protein
MPPLVNSLRAAPAALLLLALAAAACSSGGASASPTPSASVPANVEPSGDVSSQGALPSLPSGAEDLEALIPDTIGGVALQKLSMRGNEFANSGSASAEAEEFLRTLGVAPDDVSVAIGFGLSTDTGNGVAVFVFRAEGADSGRLLQAFKEATDAERETPLEWESANVGGKQVERATDPEQDNRVYLYVNDDLLAFVATTNEDDAAEVLGGMP